jgi:hypothetical protein
MSEVVEYLPTFVLLGKHKALSLNPSNTKRKKKIITMEGIQLNFTFC